MAGPVLLWWSPLHSSAGKLLGGIPLALLNQAYACTRVLNAEALERQECPCNVAAIINDRCERTPLA